MQLEMLQDDLFSELEDTQPSVASQQPSTTQLSTQTVSSPYRKIDLTTAQIMPAARALASTSDDKSDGASAGQSGAAASATPSLVEQDMPSTATLLDEGHATSPIDQVLPVLTRERTRAAEKPSVTSRPVPVLESQFAGDATDDMSDDVYDNDRVTDEAIASEHQDTDGKAPGAFKTISEAAGFLGVPQHVLRFWESRFSQIKPLKMRGGRRYYRPEDMEVLSTIKHLLYKQGYTIKGAKKVFSTRNREALEAAQRETTAATPAVVKKVVEKVVEKPVFDERKKKQLSTIRNELLGLRDTLQTYLT